MNLGFFGLHSRGVKSLGINGTFIFIVMIAFKLFYAGSASAHQLSVFAKVGNDTVSITAKFADGSEVKSGVLRVFDVNDDLVLQQEVGEVWPITLPAEPYRAGLRVVIDAGNGHDGYWILTPGDFLQNQQK